MTVKKICILGLGHLGVPLGAIIALKCPEIRVTVVQTNPDHVFQLNVKKIPAPMYTPGLEEPIRKCQNKNLFFATCEEAVIKEADVIFILSESKLKPFGEGKNQCIDLSFIEDAAYLIAEHAESNKIVVENSCIPLRAAECIKTILQYNSRPDIQFQVLSNPEFYEEGSSLKNLLYPDCVLIGSDTTPEGLAAAKTLSCIYERWVPLQKIVTQQNWTAELTRVATTAMIAQTLASIYSMAAICEESDADVAPLIKVLQKDPTIKPEVFQPNLSVGRFPAAVLNIIYMCEVNDLQQVADYWRQVLEMYHMHKDRFMGKLIWTLNQTSWNKRVAVLGFAYHKDTEMTKGSAAISLCKELAQEMMTISIYDPKVKAKKVIDDLLLAGCGVSEENLHKLVTVYSDPYKATYQVQAIVGCGHWSELKCLDYKRIFCEMVKPAFVFDSGLIFDHSELVRIGFKVYSFGKFLKNNL